jgi:hypothetical protein
MIPELMVPVLDPDVLCNKPEKPRMLQYTELQLLIKFECRDIAPQIAHDG